MWDEPYASRRADAAAPVDGAWDQPGAAGPADAAASVDAAWGEPGAAGSADARLSVDALRHEPADGADADAEALWGEPGGPGGAGDALGGLWGEPAGARPGVGAVEVFGPADGRYLVRAGDHQALCDALAATPRPPGRLRVAVDPLRI